MPGDVGRDSPGAAAAEEHDAVGLDGGETEEDEGDGDCAEGGGAEEERVAEEWGGVAGVAGGVADEGADPGKRAQEAGEEEVDEEEGKAAAGVHLDEVEGSTRVAEHEKVGEDPGAEGGVLLPRRAGAAVGVGVARGAGALGAWSAGGEAGDFVAAGFAEERGGGRDVAHERRSA